MAKARTKSTAASAKKKRDTQEKNNKNPVVQQDEASPVDEASRAVACNLTGNRTEGSAADAKKRRLARRDTTDQVQRIRAKKLSIQHDDILLDSVQGKTTGLSVDAYIAAEVRTKKIQDGNVSASFWKVFYKEFDLCVNRFTRMRVPSHKAEDADPMLMEAILLAQSKNPINKIVEPYQRN